MIVNVLGTSHCTERIWKEYERRHRGEAKSEDYEDFSGLGRNGNAMQCR